MKIVEFGEDGKPRHLKQGETPAARETIAETGGIKVRSFSGDMHASAVNSGTVAVGRIKILEFGYEGAAEESLKASTADRMPSGAARIPQSIKIVDFDKQKGGAPLKPTPAQERPRGMKIVEME